MRASPRGAILNALCVYSKGSNQAERAKAIVQAVAHYDNPEKLANVSTNLGEAMVGLTISKDMPGGMMARRGQYQRAISMDAISLTRIFLDRLVSEGSRHVSACIACTTKWDDGPKP